VLFPELVISKLQIPFNTVALALTSLSWKLDQIFTGGSEVKEVIVSVVLLKSPLLKRFCEYPILLKNTTTKITIEITYFAFIILV
jgi:hypothetical protein